MFALISPLFFYVIGSIGVIIPLVLHLIQNRKTVKMPFSTIRFLLLAQEKSASRIRMENILLWIIRTCLLVFLALAFAMPMLRSKRMGTFFGRSPRDVAIVIDGSYSMDYNLGSKTVWTKSIDTATVICEGLSEQDRLCIFVARDHVEPIIEQLSGDIDAAISQIKALEFTQRSSQLAPAVMAAYDALTEADTRREREIHIITDMQALPWDSFGSQGATGDTVNASIDSAENDETENADPATTSSIGVWDPGKIDQKRSTFFVSLLGAESPENMSPLQLKIEPQLILANTSSKATVRIGYTGPAKSTTATLWIDDKEVSTQSIIVDANQTVECSFLVPPMSGGWHAARVEIPDDNLLLDNTFHVLVSVKERFPTLCVGSRDDTLFLRAALKAGQSKGGIEADWVEPGSINEDKLAEYSCIFLCNALPLAGGEVSALESFVDRGGLLVVFPGNSAMLGDYQAWNCLPALPTMIEPVGNSKRKEILHWETRQHALLQSLKIGESTLSVVNSKRLVWDKLEEHAESIILHGENPFMAGRKYGHGYVLLFSVSADRSWTDFPLSPFYLPIIHQIVEFGAGVGSHPQYVWCSDNIPLSQCLPEATYNTVLEAPDGTRLPVSSTLMGLQTVLSIENLNQAGIYRMTPPNGGEPVPALAVNMQRTESNLTPLDPAEIPDKLAVENVQVARDQEELLAQLMESRVGITFGEHLLWVVLILAILEFLLANRLSKGTSSMGPKLGIDAAGKPSTTQAGGGSN